MSYLSRWQPLVDENAHTALTLGFMRHAPTALALEPWLSKILERGISAAPLTRKAFWPTYPSVVEGSTSTEPELVFLVDDGAPLTIVIEAKPGYAQQMLEQITREVVDTAHNTSSERIACIMIGADLGPPMPLDEWQAHVASELARHGLADVRCELRYAAWASLGHAANDCARSAPEWTSYADDVVEQLRLNVLMGYDGAPSLAGIEGGLTIGNAIEIVHRTIESARQFFLLLHGQRRFATSGLKPYSGYHRILRDGASEAPTQGAAYFATTVLLALYRHPGWRREHVVFASIALPAGKEPHLHVGAGWLAEQGETPVYRWAGADDPAEWYELRHLEAADRAELPFSAAYDPGAEWIFDTRAWLPDRADDDIGWALDKVEAAVSAVHELNART